MKLLIRLVVASVLLGGVWAPAHAEDPQLTVQWPDDTEVEVDFGPEYKVSITDAGGGTLYAEWQGTRQELPHEGWVDLQFTRGGKGVIRVLRCFSDTDCVDTGEASPEITVYREVYGAEAVAAEEWIFQGGTQQVTFQLGAAANLDVELVWRLASGTATFTGTAMLALDENGRGTFPVAVPATAPHDYYSLDIRAEMQVEPFGLHQARTSTGFVVRSINPALTLNLSAAKFYPYPDDFHDTVTVTWSSDREVTYVVDVMSDAGRVVRHLDAGTMGSGWDPGERQLIWDGRDDAGRLVKAGTYTIRFHGRDPQGREDTATGTVVVSRQRLVGPGG